MDELKCFCYTFSEDTVKKILSGEAYLSAGGAKIAGGTMLELGKPVIVSQEEMSASKTDQNNVLLPTLQKANMSLEISMKNINEIKEVSWLTYVATQQLSCITLEGFMITLDRLDKIADQLSQVKQYMENKNTSELIEKVNRYKRNLKNYAGYLQDADMDISELRTTIIPFLDEISSFIDRINKEFLDQIIDGRLAIGIITGLVGPFAYVLKRCSALYYYLKQSLPPAFGEWIDTLKAVAENKLFRQRLMHIIRVETNLSMENKFMACNKLVHNVSDCINAIEFEREYILEHPKEEYLSMEKSLLNKIEAEDYEKNKGFIYVKL